MRAVLFLIISICISKSQDYKLTCFGIHIADIKQKSYDVGKIEYEVQSRGLADLVWPTNNKYYNNCYSRKFTFRTYWRLSDWI